MTTTRDQAREILKSVDGLPVIVLEKAHDKVYQVTLYANPTRELGLKIRCAFDSTYQIRSDNMGVNRLMYTIFHPDFDYIENAQWRHEASPEWRAC